MTISSATAAQDDFSRATEAAAFIRQKTSLQPKIALVLGSGLGAFADELAERTVIPYSEIPHFPTVGAEGHAGNLVIGKVGEVPVAAMQGRVHFYEGHSMQRITFPVRVFALLGIHAILLPNAASGINLKYSQGSLVVIKDHINFQGSNPLIGSNDERFGVRFPDMTEATRPAFPRSHLEEARRRAFKIFIASISPLPLPATAHPPH